MKLILSLIAVLTLSVSLTSCNSSDSGYYGPTEHYNCYPVYDYWGYYLYDDCYWEYYNVEGEVVNSELDMQAEVADIETFKVERISKKYVGEFGLSTDDAMQMAKNVNDFSALQNRSESDLADFAQKMYGINPTTLISAIGKAQVGQNSELDALIETKAADFNITIGNAKALLQDLHGNALEVNGINL